MSFGVLEMSFSILEMSFSILEMSFGILEKSFSILEMSFSILEMSFSILEMSFASSVTPIQDYESNKLWSLCVKGVFFGKYMELKIQILLTREKIIWKWVLVFLEMSFGILEMSFAYFLEMSFGQMGKKKPDKFFR